MTYDYLSAVEEIQRRYPPERIARSRERLTAIWGGQSQPDAIPFIFTGVPDRTGANGNMLYFPPPMARGRSGYQTTTGSSRSSPRLRRQMICNNPISRAMAPQPRSWRIRASSAAPPKGDCPSRCPICRAH